MEKKRIWTAFLFEVEKLQKVLHLCQFFFLKLPKVHFSIVIKVYFFKVFFCFARTYYEIHRYKFRSKSSRDTEGEGVVPPAPRFVIQVPPVSAAAPQFLNKSLRLQLSLPKFFKRLRKYLQQLSLQRYV